MSSQNSNMGMDLGSENGYNNVLDDFDLGKSTGSLLPMDFGLGDSTYYPGDVDFSSGW